MQFIVVRVNRQTSVNQTLNPPFHLRIFFKQSDISIVKIEKNSNEFCQIITYEPSFSFFAFAWPQKNDADSKLLLNGTIEKIFGPEKISIYFCLYRRAQTAQD